MVLIDDTVRNSLLEAFGSDKNICQASIAKATGIQQSSISRWLSGETKHMGDDNWLKIHPLIKDFLPEGYIPKDIHGKNRLFLTQSYERSGLINRMHINSFNTPNINPRKDPLEALLLKYFNALPNDAKKLEIIAMVQEMSSNTTEE